LVGHGAASRFGRWLWPPCRPGWHRRTMLLSGFLPVLCPPWFSPPATPSRTGPSRDGARGAPRWLSPRVHSAGLDPCPGRWVLEKSHPRKTFWSWSRNRRKTFLRWSFLEKLGAPKVRTWRARVLVRWGSFWRAEGRPWRASLLRDRSLEDRAPAGAPLATAERSSGAPAPRW